MQFRGQKTMCCMKVENTLLVANKGGLPFMVLEDNGGVNIHSEVYICIHNFFIVASLS